LLRRDLFDDEFVGVAVGVGGEEFLGHPDIAAGADFKNITMG